MAADRSMIVSPEALTRLVVALQQYRTRTSSTIAEIASDLSRRLKHLEAVREEAQREVRHRQRVLSECDEDDDYGRARAELEAAEERLSKAGCWVEQAADTLPQFKRVNQGAQVLVGNRLPRAISVLEEKFARYMDYANVQIPNEGAGRGYSTVAAGPSSAAVGTGVISSGRRDYSDNPLPSGFQWVRLDSISPEYDLRPEETFHKLSEAEVQAGFSMLSDEVLPALKRDITYSTHHFAQHDLEKGRSYADGAQRVYEAFFGMDCVILDKGRGDGQYGVTNGRHRIYVARALGWPAIPAKIV